MRLGVLFTSGVAALLVAEGAARAQAARPAPRSAAPATAASKPAARVSASADTAMDAVTRAFLAKDADFYARRLDAQRAEYLARAAWADLGDRCNPGSLRIFPSDTTPAQREALQQLVERMEQTIIARGVGARLESPEARALYRVIVGWEAGIDRPLWDVTDTVRRVAVAAGLTGDVPDPRGAGCLPSPLAADTVTFVLPGVQTLEFPRAPKPRVKAYFGPQGQQRARDEFFAAVGRAHPDSALQYIVVAPVVLWREWALVGVDRPKENGGIAIGSASNGGAVYLLRRVRGTWRLLAVVRSWGS